MDLRHLTAPPSEAERTAVDAVLGPPESGWDGGEFDAESGRIAVGGHSARACRHLLLPTLHALRDARGWITEGGLGYVCQRLTIPPAEAYGVATFYALLGVEERPDRIVHVCDDVMCARLASATEATLRSEGASPRPSPCLGGCANPAATLEDVAGSTLASGTDAPPVPQDRGELRLLRRIGVVDPSSIQEYREHGGFAGLIRARELGPEGVLEEIERSNLRGRGGAAFPVAVKWAGVRAAGGETKHVIANGDESEPGTFKDRVLMESDPFAVVEGLLIAAEATGATKAWIYVRAEYPTAIERLRAAIAAVESVGINEGLEVELRVGAGAYICGEETALFASIEGHRGEPRQKPPFPTTSGLFGQPTAINNIETLVAVVDIAERGGETFAIDGTDGSTGRKLFSLSGDIACPGVYEVPFGTPLADLIELAGGTDGQLGAVLLGGAAGTFVGPDSLDLELSIEGAAAAGATVGSGAVMVFNDSTDFGAIVRRIAAFFRDESCGKCVPCRIGTVRQEEALIRLDRGKVIGSIETELHLLSDIDAVMTDASICGLGRTAASAVRSAISLGLIGVVA
ncbi:MAG: NADH-ubiquinone oxidoreductase-F iron-sulfur binding region domain-containing protein [Acidimicrobiia bacterium]